MGIMFNLVKNWEEGGVCGSGWVGEFLKPTHICWIEKLSTQPNLSYV